MTTQDFETIKVNAQERTLINSINTGWMRLYGYMQKLEDNPKSLDLLAKILAVELNGNPRRIILTRVHMRYCAMRQRLEFAKIARKAGLQ